MSQFQLMECFDALGMLEKKGTARSLLDTLSGKRGMKVDRLDRS